MTLNFVVNMEDKKELLLAVIGVHYFAPEDRFDEVKLLSLLFICYGHQISQSHF